MGKGEALGREWHGKGRSVGKGTAWMREQRAMKMACRWLKL